jgi:hypothetical protein
MLLGVEIGSAVHARGGAAVGKDRQASVAGREASALVGAFGRAGATMDLDSR